MSIFKNSSYAWWQMGLFKLALLAIGIAIGANWPQVFAEYTALLLSGAVALGVYLGYVWFSK